MDCRLLPLVSGGVNPPAAGRDTATLVVASLNTGRNLDAGRLLKDLRGAEPLRNADVILLQEVLHPAAGKGGILDALAEALRMRYVFAAADQWDGGYLHGLAILTRHQLADPRVIPLKRFNLRFNNRCRLALSANLATPAGSVRIVNVHLDTRINPEERIDQIGAVTLALSGLPGPCMIGGDFNTADFRWYGRWFGIPWAARQEDAVVRKLEGEGFSTPFKSAGGTHRYLPLKLDWIFLRNLESEAFGVEDTKSTDHKALWVRLRNIR